MQDNNRVNLTIYTLNPAKSFKWLAQKDSKYNDILKSIVQQGGLNCKQEHHTNGAIYDISINKFIQGEELEKTINQIHTCMKASQVSLELTLLKEQEIEKAVKEIEEKLKIEGKEQPFVDNLDPPIQDESDVDINQVKKINYHFIIKDGNNISQEFSLTLASNITVQELNQLVYEYLQYSDRNVVDIDLYYGTSQLKANKTVCEQMQEGKIEVRLRWIGGAM